MAHNCAIEVRLAVNCNNEKLEQNLNWLNIFQNRFFYRF